MLSTAIVAGCLLFGQLPALSGPAVEPKPKLSPAILQPQAGEKKPARRRLTPPEIVAEAIVLPTGHRLTGSSRTLLAVLSSTTDRRRQIDITHAYWRLVEAVADYCFCSDYDRRLRDLSAEASGEPELRTARASSAAQLRDAEAAVIAAQHDLASLAMLLPEAPLPLPVDLPHTGPYKTDFDRLPSRLTAPSTLRLIDRTLPIRRQAIDGRATAILAAEDAFEAAREAYRQNRTDLRTVLACMRQCLRQRRAMIRTVVLYNQDIADYAMVVAGPEATGQKLVGMLIRKTREPVRPLVPKIMPPQPGKRQGSDVGPVGHDEPILVPATPPTGNVPTRAVRPKADASGETIAQPDGDWAPSSPSPEATPAAPLPSKPPAKELPEEENPKWEKAGDEGSPREMDEGSPREMTEEAPAAAEREPPKPRLVPVEPAPMEPIPVEVKKPISSAEPAKPQTVLEKSQAASTAPAMYPALIDAAPGARTKQLTLALHWDRSLPEGAGSPISLEECLRSTSSRNRGAAIRAYWQARQRAAEYQVVLAQAELVDDLIHSVPAGDEFHLRRLRSAQATTRAARDEARAALVEAQYELADRLGRSSDQLWPIPSTAPHSGRYLLKLEAQPRRLAESWSLRRMAAMIPARVESVRQHATAVVEADTARAEAAAKFAEDPRSVEQVLASISRQTESTFGFLRSLTDYNLAIADYALTVLPPETPSEKLVGALVVGK